MGKWRYGVVLDAGSSGTRVHIYRWLNSAKARKAASAELLHRLPVIETDGKWTKKVHPGIATFGGRPHDVGPEYLEKLLSHALKHVPAKDVPNTPLFLLATAGMRILPPSQQKEVLKEVCDYAQSTTSFHLPDCDLHVQVIPGETEGLYGWIATNYLLGGFDQPTNHDHGKGHNTYGFLDMGGASAQIAFAPNRTEAEKHADNLTFLRLRTVDGNPLEYKVFVLTWLGFGVNQARQRYVQALLGSSKKQDFVDPCLPAHLRIKVTRDGKLVESDWKESDGPEHGAVVELLGTGNFSQCLQQTYPLLEKGKQCPDMPCMINGQHSPAVDFEVNHFVGISEYWHTTHEIFEMGRKGKAYDLTTYQERVSEFCSQDWTTIEQGIEKVKWGNNVDKERAQEVCFKASWIINMLHEGIGVPRISVDDLKTGTNITTDVVESAKAKGFLDPFQAVNKIHGVEVSWTLGKMVLYASSEVALPSDEARPVGFGSNLADPPPDFQYPGGTPLPYQSEDNWHRLFVENPRRIPALFVMLAILIFIFCLALGKQRRASVWKAFVNLFPKKQGKDPLHRRRGRSFPAKLFGLGRSSNQTYERVDLEDGEVMDDYELEEANPDSMDNDLSDSSDGTHLGITSGWATPQPKLELSSGPSYFSDGMGSEVLTQGSSVGIGAQNAFDRTGLLSRTDSRERIRSRASSPKRGKGLLSTLGE